MPKIVNLALHIRNIYRKVIYRFEAFFQTKPQLNRNQKKLEYVDYLFKNQINQNKEDFIEYPENLNVNLDKDDIHLITYYLPQYHPTDENNKWWGKGFTEWSNVTRTIPYFIGHHQPQLPIDVGFYDLRLIETQKRQIELAKKFGIFGFCFYYYWFSGKKILNKPTENYLNNPKTLNFPYCLCWANHSWSKTWENEDEILINQEYLPEDPLKFIKEITPFLKDKRYIKIDGKPLLLIYQPNDMPNPKETFKIWRNYCRNEGIGELFLINVKTFPEQNPNMYDLDGCAEQPPLSPWPQTIKKDIEFIDSRATPLVVDLNKFVNEKLYYDNVDFLQFKGVMNAWDNTARKKQNGIVYSSSPETYKKWLKDCIYFTKKNMDKNKQFVFINGWNEWAEGAHLEPDTRYGYGYLKATADAILETKDIIK